MSLHRTIESHWQQPKPWLGILLWPLSRLFQAASLLRRWLYRSGCLKTARLPVPVVVVGNIHAGGTGKTPITAALVQDLQARGIRVGIISRGYGRRLKQPHLVHAGSNADQAGDEPLMLFKQTAAPTAVAASRHEAGQLLLAACPDLQVILCDDGLQHYALHRDLELCVFPAAAPQHDVLPNGGLREPLSRLAEVDALIINHAAETEINDSATENTPPFHAFRQPEHKTDKLPARFHAHIRAAAPYRFIRPAETLHSGSLKAHETCAAAAAIARPQRFFATLADLGFPLAQTQVLPDHAALNPAELPQADYVFVTEKDAAKLPPDTPEEVWVLPIRAIIRPDLADFVIGRLHLTEGTASWNANTWTSSSAP